jgi:zinc protease
MLRKSLLALCLLSLSLLQAADSIFPYPHEELTLDNGLRAILIPMRNSSLVSYVTFVHTGSRDEVEPGKSGFAHFFEHMMFRGTEKYPSDVYAKIIADMGADTNAFTSYDYTVYYLHFPPSYAEKIVELESDRFMNLKYTLPEFQTEAKAVLGEYNKSVADPFFQLEERLNDTAFEKSTYKHTVIGFLKDIEDMPNQFNYSRTFFDRFYRPENCVLILSGNFDPTQAKSWIRKYYSPWKKGSYRAPSIPEPKQQQQKTVVVDYKGETLPILVVAYKAPELATNSKDFAAMNLTAELAFGETSALYEKLVLTDQKADLLFAQYYASRDPYLFSIYARLKKEQDFQQVQSAIDSTVEQLKAGPPDAQKLADLKSNRKYGFLMSFDTSKSIASGLYNGNPAYIALALEGVTGVDRLFDTYQSVTPQDIQQAANKWFVNNQRTIVTLKAAK